MKKLLISACLAGKPCAYDGKGRTIEELKCLEDHYILFSYCPEVEGGLPTPRDPAEITEDKVVTIVGKDVTDAFVKGAKGALKLMETEGIDTALLKARSPSCGKGVIYDGSFRKKLTLGDGVTAKLLLDRGKKVFTEEEVHLLFSKLSLPSEKYLSSYKEALGEEETDYFFGKGREGNILAEIAEYRKGTNLPENRVPAHIYWLVDQGEFIGEVSLRHRLTPALLNYGGHIGYVVRKSKRGRGYGKYMVELTVGKAKELGLKKVLITCDEDNLPSIRIIESLGGNLENKVINKIGNDTVLTRRYWVSIDG